MGTGSTDIIRGTADMLILRLLDIQPMHGWGIAKYVEQRSRESIRIQPGALYASLHRLSRQGWIRSSWKTTENGQRARYYALTPAGARRLEEETANWRKLANGVDLILSAK
ncbi:MAG: PadR family transcriptional regulator [Gemmatimonadaceae bacterium]